MDQLKAIIRSKPTWIVLLIFSYILILGVLRWRFTPDLTTVWYLLGGILGIYFMDFADFVFAIQPSPFRSVIFLIFFGIVSFFVVTSSGSTFATGLVLSVYFTLLLLAAEQWQTSRNLNSWFALMKGPPTARVQQLIIGGVALLLIVETLIFIRG